MILRLLLLLFLITFNHAKGFTTSLSKEDDYVTGVGEIRTSPVSNIANFLENVSTFEAIDAQSIISDENNLEHSTSDTSLVLETDRSTKSNNENDTTTETTNSAKNFQSTTETENIISETKSKEDTYDSIIKSTTYYDGIFSESVTPGRSPGWETITKQYPTFEFTSEISPTSSTIDPNDLETVTSIQGILSEMNTNEKIEKAIVNEMNKFSTNCNAYKPLKLTIQNFTLPPELRLDLGNGEARFFQFDISESDDEYQNWKIYTTSISCDSADSVKIQVSLPTKITISASIEIIDLSESVVNKGSIIMKLTGINIFKQFIQNEKYNKTEENVVPFSNSPSNDLSFLKSQVTLDIGWEYQILIYFKLQEFIDKLKPLQEFYTNQLKQKLEQNEIPLTSSCSNIVVHETNHSKNSFLTDLYVIPYVKFETWKGLILSAGPILIDGLLNFNSSNFIVSKPEISQKQNPVNSKGSMEREVIKRITTEHLKGKFEWQYHSRKYVFSFTIEHVDFESIYKKKIEITEKNVTLDEDSWTMPTSANEPAINMTMNVKVGKVEIETSRDKSCENENHFANFILSGYLKSLIAESLKTSIQNRFASELSLQECDDF